MELLLNGAGGAAGGATGDLIKDSDTATFMQDVIEASRQGPVLVDFWATWCGPCKTLTPILEKVVRQMGGAVRLVKVDIDRNQDLAAQLRIQSVPTVYAFLNGQPVDAFQGALPESQVRAFVDRLTGGAQSPVDLAMEEAAAALEAGDAQTAGAIYNQVLGQDPENRTALGGLIRALIAAGELDGAQRMVDGLSDKLKMTPEIEAARSALDLARLGGGDVAALTARLEADPDDLRARYDLANALYAHNRAGDAVEHLLDLVRRDRGWDDDAARRQLIKIFEALGHAHPVTVAARRRLSTLLFS